MGNLGFLTDEGFSEQMDSKTAILAGLLSAVGGSIEPASWSEIQSIVRMGLAGQVFNIGDRFTCSKGSTTLTWDVIGIDVDEPADPQFTHSLTLQLHDCLPSTMQYDAIEAFYYTSEGLEPGTYYFTVGAQQWVSGDVGKSFQFTLEEALPAGGQIVVENNYNVSYEGAAVKTYSSGASSTVIEETALAEGSEGTFLGTTAVAAGENLNCYQRVFFGSNNWAESALRQFLNSDAEAGAVWEPKTKFDRSPSWASTTAGFMNGMDDDFLAVIGKVKKVTARNTACDGGGSDETEELFWLLSSREVYAGDEVSTVTEGEPYPYYSDYSDLAAAGISADTNRIKYRNGSAQAWRLRTPTAGDGYSVRNVTAGGTMSGHYAVSNYGIAPGCCVV